MNLLTIQIEVDNKYEEYFLDLHAYLSIHCRSFVCFGLYILNHLNLSDCG